MKLHSTVTKTEVVELTLDEVREAIGQYLQKRTGVGLPNDSAIFVHVPGGGDWSNTNLNLDNDECPLVVTYKN